VLTTLDTCRPFASELESTYALDEIERLVRTTGNDARWQRETYQRRHSMAELLLESADLWRGKSAHAKYIDY
jgi:gamma-glutamyl:cysteine ligase YbdK (ATP-grasp superfamily)